MLVQVWYDAMTLHGASGQYHAAAQEGEACGTPSWRDMARRGETRFHHSQRSCRNELVMRRCFGKLETLAHAMFSWGGWWNESEVLQKTRVE